MVRWRRFTRRSAWSASTRPASVSTPRRLERSKSGWPISSSSFLIVWLIGRLGAEERLGGGGKAALAHDREKGFELEQFHRNSIL